ILVSNFRLPFISPGLVPPVLAMGSKCSSLSSLYLWNRGYLGFLRFPFKHDFRNWRLSRGVLSFSRYHGLPFEDMTDNGFASRFHKTYDIRSGISAPGSDLVAHDTTDRFNERGCSRYKGLDTRPVERFSTTSRSGIDSDLSMVSTFVPRPILSEERTGEKTQE